MNLYQLLTIFVIFTIASSRIHNTTDFWKKQLKAQTMHYQCYAGTNFATQVFKRSIGTSPKDSPPCTTASFLLGGTHPPKKIRGSLSSFGFKEDLEPARNWVPSLKMDPSESTRMDLRKPDTLGTFKRTQSSSISPQELAFREAPQHTQWSTQQDKLPITFSTSLPISTTSGPNSKRVLFTSQDNLMLGTIFHPSP